MKKFFQKYFPKTHQDIFEEGVKSGIDKEYARQQETLELIRDTELQALVNEPVIAIGNGWTDPIVGFCMRIEHPSYGKGSLPILLNAMDGVEYISFSVLVKYDEDFLKALFKLNPYERWAMVSKSPYYCSMKNEKDSPELTKTFEEFQEKLAKAESIHGKTIGGYPVNYTSPLKKTAHMLGGAIVAGKVKIPEKTSSTFPMCAALEPKYSFLPDVVRSYPETMFLSEKDQMKTVLLLVDYFEQNAKINQPDLARDSVPQQNNTPDKNAA